ncbi:Lysine-specific demethylase 3B [Hypsizygus marmoreus]|uniref:Lysine-specific demethylase 3B n=1 Tax=Hypsizygus marmoreus TaxID=39966 RepID=A0A369KBJ8_HYPMA|nr:Lysine-specific demethylase 3B [Hypsizygus marmoreus]
MSSDLRISLSATSERTPKGKVRKILFGKTPLDTHLALIAVDASSKSPPNLQFRNIAGNGHDQVIKLDKNILQLCWLDDTNPLLVVLYEDGELCTYHVDLKCDNVGVLGAPIAHLKRQLEPPLGKAHGSLDCRGTAIAFSLGKEVHVSNTSANTTDVMFSFEDILRGKGFGGFAPSTVFVTAVHITANNYILAFIAGAKRIIEYNVASKCVVRNILIQNNPCTVAISREFNLILLHDAVSGAYFYSSETLQICDLPPINGAERHMHPVPVCFGNKGKFAVVGDTTTIRVANLEEPSKIHQLKTNGKRTLALQASAVADTSIVAAVVREDRGGWEIQTWMASENEEQPNSASDSSEPSNALAASASEGQQPDPTLESSESSKMARDVSNAEISQQDSAGKVLEEQGNQPDIQPVDKSQETGNERPSAQADGGGNQSIKRVRSAEMTTSGTTIKRGRTVHDGYSSQATTCSQSSPHYPCLTCSPKLEKDDIVNPDECRFIHFRWFKDDPPSDPPIFSMLAPDDFGRIPYHEWEPPRAEAHKSLIQRATAAALIPHLRAQLVHLNREDCVLRQSPRDTSYTCDRCFMGLYFRSWFCRHCGYELCNMCFNHLQPHRPFNAKVACIRSKHSPQSFIAVSPLTFAAVDEALKGMSQWAPTGSRTQPRPVKLACPPTSLTAVINFNTKGYRRAIPKYMKSQLTQTILENLLARCEPFIITDAFAPDTPENLLDLDDSAPHSCRTTFYNILNRSWYDKQDSTLETFFGIPWDEKSGRSLQVRDYPRSGNLKDVHPRLHRRFFEALELFKDRMGPAGPLNLFSYYPKDGLPPDLGPKLYISQPDPSRIGTTFLHMDKSGAVNIMLHSEDMGHGHGARWDIWPKSDIAGLSKALNPHASSDQCATGQPIVQEEFYAGSQVLEKKYGESGRCHWSFDQFPGEAVIIPPGCPHQVSNNGRCIKIACDFVSASHIAVLEDLEVSFQKMNYDSRRSVQTDLLQLKMLLWYAWNGSH